MTTKEPTCTEAGVKTYTCTVCNETKTEEIEAPGHSYAEAWTFDAENHWYVCSRCGAADEKAAHTFGDWTVTKEATEAETGTKEHTCTVCGYKATETIPVVVSQKNLPTPNTMTIDNSTGLPRLALSWLDGAGKEHVDNMSMVYTFANGQTARRGNIDKNADYTAFILPSYYDKLSSGTSELSIKVTTTPTKEATASGYVAGEKTFTYQVSLQNDTEVAYNGSVSITSTQTGDSSWKLDAAGLKANQWYHLALTSGTKTELQQIKTDNSGAAVINSVTSEYTSCKIYEFSATVNGDSVAITRTPYNGVRTLADATGGLRWKSPGVVAWDPVQDAFGYRLYVFSGAESKWSTNLDSQYLGSAGTKFDLSSHAMEFSESGNYRVELWTINSGYQVIAKIGEVENAITVTSEGDAVGYTFTVTGEKTYSVTLDGNPQFDWCIWKLEHKNGDAATYRGSGGTQPQYVWENETWWSAFTDGDKMDLRLMTNSKVTGSNWSFTITPESIKTYSKTN